MEVTPEKEVTYRVLADPNRLLGTMLLSEASSLSVMQYAAFPHPCYGCSWATHICSEA